MSISSRWAEAKGMIWPSQEQVQNGATGAGWWALMSAWPTMIDVVEELLEKGPAAGASILYDMNFGPDGMGAAYVKGWNDYVREYRRCRNDPQGFGPHNFHGFRNLQANCLEHAKRYVEYQYPWPERASGAPHKPREETWGYTPPARGGDPSPEEALDAVNKAAIPGSGPIPRVWRRKALPEIFRPPPSSFLPRGAPSPEPSPEPEPAAPFPWAWVAVPVALILLARDK
jgi:hypothetical protein